MKRLLDEARKMIRINSVSSNGNEEIANYVATLMQDRGFKVQLQHVMHSQDEHSKRQFNVIGILGDPLVDRKIRRGLLLNTHLDTVSPGLTENWTETGGDPFAATVKDGKIFGLGAADVKLDLLCKLHAAERYRERKLKMPIYLVGTCGEEVGMFGVKYLIKSGALNPKYVVVGEPSELKVVYAHKCFNLYRISIEHQQVERDAKGFNRRIDLHAFGKSAHSSYPHLGTNAISALTGFLERAASQGFDMRFTRISGGDTVNKVPDHAMAQFYLTSHQFEDFKRFFREMAKAEGMQRAFRVELGGIGEAGVKFLPDGIFGCLNEVMKFGRDMAADFEKVEDKTYDPAFSTINMGRLKQRQGGLDLHFDLRLLPEIDPEKILEHIKTAVGAIATRYPSINLSVTRERMNPALNMSLEHELVQYCKDALTAARLEPSLAKKATSTEAAQYFQAGYEAVIVGPGRSQGNAHSPNEHCLLDQLEKAVTFYERLIERVCL